MRQKILFVSHCLFNDGTKLKNQNPTEMEEERREKRKLLHALLDAGIELVQLPCPEFILYGANRWGHASSQFDTAFFRNESKNMLKPFLLQIEEYSSHPERFEILGIVGINGSPSCGVRFTYDGEWGGEFSGNPHLQDTLASLKKEEKPGVFLKVFMEMLEERGYKIPFYSFEDFKEKNIDDTLC